MRHIVKHCEDALFLSRMACGGVRVCLRACLAVASLWQSKQQVNGM